MLWEIVRVSGYLLFIAQWQSTGGWSQEPWIQLLVIGSLSLSPHNIKPGAHSSLHVSGQTYKNVDMYEVAGRNYSTSMLPLATAALMSWTSILGKSCSVTSAKAFSVSFELPAVTTSSTWEASSTSFNSEEEAWGGRKGRGREGGREEERGREGGRKGKGRM